MNIYCWMGNVECECPHNLGSNRNKQTKNKQTNKQTHTQTGTNYLILIASYLKKAKWSPKMFYCKAYK